MSGTGEPRWLSKDDQMTWRALSMLLFRLPGPLDTQLQQESGITLFEYMVLSWLSMATDRRRRMSELAELSNGSLSRLSNVAKRLESRGWIRREPDPDDRRATVAMLTDAGMDLVVAAAPGHVAAVRALVIDPLTATQRRQLMVIAERIGDAIRCPPEPED